ncbi:MAG: class I SAM-dependent RNA methyltransferase [Pseudomonadota bacterium]
MIVNMKDLNHKNTIPESLDVRIEKLVYGGDGLARTEQGVILVPYTVPGDSVRVSSIHKRKGVLRGKIQEIIHPSLYRVSPFCDNFLKGCGGCQWQNVDYLEQVRIKTEMVEESMERIGKQTLRFPSLIHDPRFKETRLRSVFHVSHSRSEMGFYRFNTNDIMPIHECPLCASPINGILRTLQEDISSLESTYSLSIITNGKDTHLHLEGRRREKKEYLYELYESLNHDRDCSIGISCSGQRGDLLYLGLQSIDFLTGEFKYLANARTFFQGHRTLNGKLIEIIRNLVGEKKGTLLLDLFSGVSFLSIPVSSHFDRVVSIDNEEESIRLAKENAKLNGVTNMEFYKRDLGSKDCLSDITSVDVVILDPPRSGCPRILIEELGRLNPSQIIMVSCNPATMARDLRILINGGYEIISCHGIDLFPQTFHVETIVSLTKA